MKRRILSIVTALALCLSLCPTWAFATEADPSLCKHHPEHTEDCGYTAPTEGHDCGHRHTAECYTKGVLPDADGGDYYEIGADTENLLDCQHSHDSACGYVQADPGAPCGYVCRICPIEDLIDALPEQVTEDNADDVRAQLDHILDLYRELDEGEQEEIDLSRIYALQGALDAANAPVAAEEVTINNATVKTLIAEDGGCQGHTFTGTAQRAMIYVESGAHNVTFSGLTISESAKVGIAPGAAMNLTIEGTNTISATINCAGIYVPADAALTIDGAGSLDVSGNAIGAGIGGAVYAPDENGSEGDPNCGTVEIKGGTVTATGGGACAGIGGGSDANNNPGNGGTVTINGGTVTATGGSDSSGYYGGAGIGGSAGVSASDPAGNGGTLTISGGHVTLTTGHSTAYGFGQGTGKAPGGTCELTLTDASYLTVDSLDPNGKYTINGDPTADMIVVPELVYTGEVLDTSGIKIDDSKTGTGTYFGQTFTVNASADGWTYTIDPAVVKAAGDYTVTFSKEGHTSISKTFTVAQSGTQFVGDGEVKTYNGNTLTTSFSAGDTITVKATPTPTGDAPQKAAARLRGEPGTGQMALYVGDALVSSEAANADTDGSYTMTVSAADVLLAAGGPKTGITLTARFTANDNMADGAGTATVNITAAAKAEKDGKVIGYYGESNLEAAFAADSGNAGATFTLLANVERLFSLYIYIDCTLDLGGHTITTGENRCIEIQENTSVTIRGEGEIRSENIALLVCGSATLEGGTYTSTGSEDIDHGVDVDENGTLSVTGEKVTIRNTGGRSGLLVGAAKSVQLSAGKYEGATAAIESSLPFSNMLAHTDNTRYAFFQNDIPVTKASAWVDGNISDVPLDTPGAWLTGTVTVRACDHAGVAAMNNGDGTHRINCPYCGYHSEHTTTLTATVSGNTVTFRGGCESCDYRAETLATAAFTIPKLTYGQTDQTVSCTWEHPNGYALMVQIDSGEELQLESSDTQVSLPLKQLFGSQEINAGNYQLHVYCRSYADVTSNVCSLPVTVDPAPLPEVTLSAESATYSGTEQKPALSVKQGETPLTEGTDYEVSYTRDGVVTNDFTSAGTVNITVTGKGNYTGSVEKTYTIGKATPTIAWANNVVTLTYTGQPADIKPVVTLVNGETFSGAITYHHTNTDSSESGESKAGLPTNAGIYVVGARIPEQDNYTAATTASLMLMINKADQTVPAAPTADEENIKDTSITLDTIENAEYKRDDGEWQDSPVFTDLSPNTPYTFYARLKEDANHNASPDSAAASITTKKTMLNTAVVTVSGTYTYTGAAIVPEAGSVEVVLNGTKIDSDQYTISATGNVNAGTAKLTVTATENGSYSGSASTTFTISPATPALAWSSTTQELAYTGSAATITAPTVTLVGSDTFSGTITYSHAAQGGTEFKDGLPTNAGTYTIKASIAAQGNYTAADSTNTLTLTIKPTPVTLTFADQTIAYGDTPTGATADPASAKIEYSYTTEAGGTPISGWPTNAGTYTVTAKVEATGNYGGAIQTATLTINPKEVSNPTIELSPSSFDYDGTAKKPAVTVKDGTTVIPASEYTVAYSNNINAGTATVTITDKTGGNYTVSGTTTFTITAKPLTGAKVEATGTFTYTGNAQEPAPTVTLGGQPLTANTDYTVTYDDNTNAGTAKITVTGTGNYSGTAQGTFTIGRADLTADGTGIASGTYGDKLSGLTVSGLTAKLGEATVTGTWKLTGDTVPNVGDSGQYTATFTPATGAGNYNALTAQVTLSIAKANYTGTTTASTSAKFGTTGTYDLSALLPDGATAGTAATTSDIFEGTPTVSGKALTYQLKAGATVGNTGPITVPVISTNYQEFNLTITVTVTDKFVPTLTVSPITVTYSGEAIPGTAIKGTAKVGSTTVPGTWAFASGEAVTNVADSGTKTVKFVPTDKATYAEATAVVVVTIGKATPTGAPKYTAISASGKTLADAGLTTEGGTFSTGGAVAWVLAGTTEVTANTQYEWTFTPTDTANYNTLTGKITLWVQSTGGGSYVPSGPSSPGTSTLPVTTTGQGSTTTTTTTTAAPTASTQGGTAATTISTTMGQEIVKQAVANNSETVVIAPKVTGSVTKAEVSIPASTVGQIGSQTNASLTVSTPVANVTIPNGGLGSLGSAGGTVTVTAEQTGNSVELTVTAGGQTVQNVPGGMTLTVPAASTTPGTVAVLVHPDGTREVVRKSVADNGAVTIPLDGSAKLEIVDNSGHFADVPATSWAADAVAFASSHELFNGTAPGQFSPNVPMSRGMLAVVLHNLESNPAQALTGAFADVDNSQWYAEGVAWAEAQGIIGGYGNGRFGPNDNITREQLAVMLWRYAGSPAATDRELHFADAHRASNWALEALRWATENGIINGKGGGILDPTGQATRAETAQMLKNFMESK